MSTAQRNGVSEPESDRPPLPRSGDVLHVTREASVQFSTPIHFRVIRVHDWPTYTGWIWLDGYQLNGAGEAVERRSIFVQADQLRRVSAPPPPSRAQRNSHAGRRPAPLQTRRPQPG
jgi:hypothetical protein